MNSNAGQPDHATFMIRYYYIQRGIVKSFPRNHLHEQTLVNYLTARCMVCYKKYADCFGNNMAIIYNYINNTALS